MKVEFRPTPDGFAFVNDWLLDTAETDVVKAAIDVCVLPVALTFGPLAPAAIIALNAALDGVRGSEYGLCGGMAAGAADYFDRRWLVSRGAGPHDQPERVGDGGTAASDALRSFIWTRLLQSIENSGTTFIGWMVTLKLLPGIFGGGRGRLADWTLDQFRNAIKPALDHGQVVCVGLIGETWNPLDNHQVLAYGYETDRLYIYDNNFPDTEITLIFSGSGDSFSIVHSGYPAGFDDVQGPLRGFFMVGRHPGPVPPLAVHCGAGPTTDHPGPVTLGDQAQWTVTATNAAYRASGALALEVTGNPLAAPGEDDNAGIEPASAALATNASRAFTDGVGGYTYRGTPGTRRFRPVARVTNSDGVQVTRFLPHADGTDAAVDVSVQLAPEWPSFGGILNGAPFFGRNADGRLELFGLGTDSHLWHIWQTAPSNGWSGWAQLGADRTLTGRGHAVANADGRMEVFAAGTDGGCAHVWQTAPSNGWSHWDGLGGSTTGHPSAVRNADGHLEVFVRTASGHLAHRWLGPTGWWPPFGSWDDLGSPPGGVVGNPAASHDADGRIEVFVRGGDGALWHTWQGQPNGTFVGHWTSRGGAITSDPAVGVSADGRMEVFARGSGGSLVHVGQTAPSNGWSDWADLGGAVHANGSIAVVTSPHDGPHVFALAPGGDVTHTHELPAAPWWTPISSLGGRFLDGVDAALNSDGRIELIVRGADRAVYHRWETAPGGAWNA